MSKKRKAEILPSEVLDTLLEGHNTAESLLGKDGLIKELTKALLERALESELTDHLGYEKHSRRMGNNGNARNGQSSKTLKTDQGALPIAMPRDRSSEFDPQKEAPEAL